MRDLERASILVTGGAGFIGSALIRFLIQNTRATIINVDKLNYAGNLESLSAISESSRYHFERADICDASAIAGVLRKYRPHAVTHLAAESHVDRSIDGPAEFIKTNIVGTYILLDNVLEYWSHLRGEAKDNFIFHHVSTDEVYGSLGETGQFTETTAYRPRSPYSASKAASDASDVDLSRSQNAADLAEYSGHVLVDGYQQGPLRDRVKEVVVELDHPAMPMAENRAGHEVAVFIEDGLDA